MPRVCAYASGTTHGGGGVGHRRTCIACRTAHPRPPLTQTHTTATHAASTSSCAPRWAPLRTRPELDTARWRRTPTSAARGGAAEAATRAALRLLPANTHPLKPPLALLLWDLVVAAAATGAAAALLLCFLSLYWRLLAAARMCGWRAGDGSGPAAALHAAASRHWCTRDCGLARACEGSSRAALACLACRGACPSRRSHTCCPARRPREQRRKRRPRPTHAPASASQHRHKGWHGVYVVVRETKGGGGVGAHAL